MGLWSALGPISTCFLISHGVAMMRTTPEGQMAQVLGPGVRVAFVFPPWLSNICRTAMSPSSGGCRTRGGTGGSFLESRKCASAHHTWVWILVLATPGCFLDAGSLCGEEPPLTSTQLELWGKNSFRSDCPVHGRTTSGDSKFSANSAGLPPARLTSPGGDGTLSPRPADSLGMFSVAPPPFQSQLASSS